MNAPSLLVCLLVRGAALLAARSIWRAFQGKACPSGCAHCPHGSCPARQLPVAPLQPGHPQQHRERP